MKKIAIIGAGVTGLSLSKMLKPHFNVEILEQNSEIGGIAKTKKSEKISYHTVGGHCINSKYKEVMNFIFEIMNETEFNKIKRDAKILFKDNFIPYPIEFSIKEINTFDKNLAFNITKDLLSSKQISSSSNLYQWFIEQFGETLAREYFIPYNEKIWATDLNKMSSDWVIDKLPIPSKIDFFDSLMKKKSDNMPHSSFYYPKSNNQNTFLNNLAKDSNILLNYKVKKIEKIENKWLINNEKAYDILINTSPLNEIHKLIHNIPKEVESACNLLKFNKVSNILWKSKAKDFSWLYLPSREIKFHRIINIGKFFKPNTNHMISEAIGDIDFKTMVEEGSKLDFLLEPLDYNISNHAYVIFDENTKKAKEIIFKFLNSIDLITAGRFGEWEYYNMDICIKRAIDISSKLLKDKT